MEVLPPPVGTVESSVADTLRANFEKARQKRTQEFEFPTISGLFVVFRPIRDIAEVNGALESVQAGMEAAQTEVEIALRLLLASAVTSYAMVNGERHEIGLPLGLRLYDYIFPVQNGEIRPGTDAEAVTMMFADDDGSTDTLSLVMFARKLDVSRKMFSALVEAEPGKS